MLLNAVVSSEGSIEQLECVGGPDELRDAAMDAVKQWQYSPIEVNGRRLEEHIRIGVVFSLTTNDYKAVAESNYPVSAEVFASSEPVPPPRHSAPEREGEAPISDTIEGIKMQTAEVFTAWRNGDQKRFQELLDGFAFEDPTMWLTSTFGPEEGPALVRDYEISFEKFKGHMLRVVEYAKETTDLYVEDSVVPNPPEEAGQPDGPPAPLQPLKVENFRFFVTTGPGDWVFSFVYADGAFHIIGGTHTFWNGNWRLKQDMNQRVMVMTPIAVK